MLRRAFYIMSNEVDEVISTSYRSSYVELRFKGLMYDLAELLATIKKATEYIQNSERFFESPPSLKQRKDLQKNKAKMSSC